MRSFSKSLGLAGLIFLIFGFIAWWLTRVVNWYVYSQLGIGAVLIVLYYVFNFDTFIERIKERSAAEGGKVLSYSAFVVAIIIVVNVIVYYKDFKKWDVTSTNVYSLEEQSKKVLKNLKEKVHVRGFYQPQNSSKEGFRDMAKRYSYESKQLTFEVVDPNAAPEIARRLGAKDGTIHFEYGPDDLILNSYDENKLVKVLEKPIMQIYVFADDPEHSAYLKLSSLLAKPDYQSKANLLRRLALDSTLPVGVDENFSPREGSIYVHFARNDTVLTGLSEEEFTNAIIQIARSESPVVYFTTGHGERDIDGEEGADLSMLKRGINNEGYEVKTISGPELANQIPKDASILIVAGPQTSFSENTVKVLDQFLESGGNVIFMAEPYIVNPDINPNVTLKKTGLEELTKKWGIQLGNDIVLQRVFAGITQELQTVNYGDSEITNAMQRSPTAFISSRSLTTSNTSVSKAKVTEVIKTLTELGQSWGETDLAGYLNRKVEFEEGKDQAGPVVMMATAEKDIANDESPKQTKFVVFGDVDFITNQQLSKWEFNYDLLLNTLGWMEGNSELLSIRPKRIRPSKVLLTPQQNNMIFYVAVLTVPEFFLLIGLIVYRRRRSL